MDLAQLLSSHKANKDNKVSDSRNSSDDDHDVDDSNDPIKPHKETSQDVTESVFSPPSQKVFPERIIRNDLKEQDTQSNASSTDDYVAELLDPNDRPRNVWHMVEAPKRDEGLEDSRDKSSNLYDESGVPLPPDHITDSNLYSPHHPDDDGTKNVHKTSEDYTDKTGRRSRHRDDDDDIKRRSTSIDRHGGRNGRSPERSSKSSRRSHGHSRDDREDRRRDRSRDRHGHRSSSRRSSRRRHADDEDSYRGHRSSRRSRSRSPRTSSRRRDRSRSDSRRSKRDSKTILIMQLNSKVTERDLKDYFSRVGFVKEIRLIMDNKSGRHKGIAYIEFEDSHSASKAYRCNGENFFGAPLVIHEAGVDDWASLSSRNAHHTSDSSSRSNLPSNSYRIYVGALHVGITEEMLRSLFEPFGPIIKMELMKDRLTNVSRGYAFITFANIEDGQFAVKELDGMELGGKAIKVSKSMDKNERSTGGDASGLSRGGGITFGHSEPSSESRGNRPRDVTASLFELAGQ